jgi:hypothetical protein
VHDHVSITQAQSEAEGITQTITEAAEPAVERDTLPAPAPEYRPEWISANEWITLPAMLRAALLGSTMTEGTLQMVSPHLARLLATRYACEIAALGVSVLAE